MTDREFLMTMHDLLGSNGLRSYEELARMRCIIGRTPAWQKADRLFEYFWPGQWRSEKAPFVGAIPKPALGLRPRYISIKDRMDEIMEAVARYHAGKKNIPREWIEEWLTLSESMRGMGGQTDSSMDSRSGAC